MTKIRKINYIASIVVMILAIFAISANVLAEEAPEETTEAAPLEVTCSADVEYIKSGDSITWTAEVSGGSGTYFYGWSGTDDLTGSSASVSKTYTASGAKTASVTVSDDLGNSEVADCGSVKFIEPLEFVSCTPSENTSNTGYEVSWDVNFTGGIAPYFFVISGDDGFSGDENEAKITYTTAGTKNAEVTGVSSTDGQALAGPFSCSPVEIVEAPAEMSVSCSANASSVDEGEEVTWSAEISGGLAPFTYDWSGADGLSGSSEEVSKTYSSDGDKSASVTVTSSDGQAQIGVSCGSVSVEEVSSGGSSTGGSRRNNNNNDDTDTTTESGSGSNTTTTTTVGGGTNTGGSVLTAGTVAGATTTATSSDDTATTTDDVEAEDDENLNQLAGLFAFFGEISAWIWFILFIIVLGLILWFILARNKREDEGEGSSN